MRILRNAALALLTVMPILAAAATAPAGAAAPASAPNIRLEDLTVMALGALDGRAVLKGPDGKLQVLKVGDTIPGTQAVISQVLADKILLKDKTQTVWISKPTQPGGKSTVQRIDSEAPPPRIVQGQVVKTLPAPPASTSTKKTK